MSAELGLIAGLGIIAYVLTQIAEKVQDADTDINRGIFALSIFFIIGLEYTAYGIAQSQSFSNAETAYLVALIITSISFLGLLAVFAQNILEKTGKDEMDAL